MRVEGAPIEFQKIISEYIEKMGMLGFDEIGQKSFDLFSPFVSEITPHLSENFQPSFLKGTKFQWDPD